MSTTVPNDESDVVVHLNPVLGNVATSFIYAPIEGDVPRTWEKFWALKTGDNRFKLCCIPFFLYNFALGDEVETMHHERFEYVVTKVVATAGHYTIRVWFGDADLPSRRTDVQ